MKFAIETWATEYGTPYEPDQLTPLDGKVELTCEKQVAEWAPVSPSPSDGSECVLFTDGVRRVDARVWIETEDGTSRPGVCATYAAGAICCDGRAEVTEQRVERGLFSAVTAAAPINTRHVRYEVRRAEGDQPEQLWTAIQQRMSELEASIASTREVDLVVVDGPLRSANAPANAIGYVKTHHVAYLPEEVAHVVPSLQPGQRTPLFLSLGRFSKFSWYVKLPGANGHSWAGVVRCEASADTKVDDAIALADKVTAILPRFASTPHKDPRAPQNLYPIAGLERELRRRLGDPLLLYRDLKIAAAN